MARALADAGKVNVPAKTWGNPAMEAGIRMLRCPKSPCRGRTGETTGRN